MDPEPTTTAQLAARIEQLLGVHAGSMAAHDVRTALQLATSRFLAQRNATKNSARLPHDVLSMIFMLLDQNGRMRVSAVCRHWRCGALQDKRLWRDVSILVDCHEEAWEEDPDDKSSGDDDDDDDASSDSSPEPRTCCLWDHPTRRVTSNHRLLPLFLRRCKGVPAALHLHFWAHCQTVILQQIIAILAKHAAHIGSLAFLFEGCDAWARILAFLPKDMPTLSHMALMREDPLQIKDVGSFGMCTADRWTRYPSLSSVELGSVIDAMRMGRTEQCSTLKHLSLSCVELTPDSLASYLRAFPNLERLDIRYCEDVDVAWSSLASFPVNHNLREVRMTHDSLEFYDDVVEALGGDKLRLVVRASWSLRELERANMFSHLSDVEELSVAVDDTNGCIDVSAVDITGRERRAHYTTTDDNQPVLSLIAGLRLRTLTTLAISNHAWKHLDMLPDIFPTLRTLSLAFIPKKRFMGSEGIMHLNVMNHSSGLPGEPDTGHDCDPTTIMRLARRLECPSLQLLSFQVWRPGAKCIVPAQLLVTAAESIASPIPEISIQGLSLTGEKGSTVEEGLASLGRLTHRVVYRRNGL